MLARNYHLHTSQTTEQNKISIPSYRYTCLLHTHIHSYTQEDKFEI